MGRELKEVIPKELMVDKYKVEIIFDEPDVLFHVFGLPNEKGQKAKLIEKMDKTINDMFTLAYEDMFDSWFIRIFGFFNRINPEEGAVALIQSFLQDL